MSDLKEKSVGTRPPTETAVVYGHDTRKFRLRAVNAEKDAFSKYMFKPLGKKISWAQIIIAVLIAGIQMVTMSLVTGRYTYYDAMLTIGGGIWSSIITFFAAFLTLWSFKRVKYWKLHLSFAMHIVSVLGSIVILCVECGGNLYSLRYHAGEALYRDTDYNIDRYSTTPLSASVLITSLILNTAMATGTLVQLVASFVMTIMTGRAICCGQTKEQMHGKLFELEISGNDTTDGAVVVTKSYTDATKNQHQMGVHLPPPYAELSISNCKG